MRAASGKITWVVMGYILQIIGGMLLGLAVVCGLMVVDQTKSSDPHQHSLAHGGLLLAAIFAGTGLLLVISGVKINRLTGKPRKSASATYYALLGLALIVFSVALSYRTLIILTSRENVKGEILSVDEPKVLHSGKKFFHLTYRYIDAAGIERTGNDSMTSTDSPASHQAIDIAYSSYDPAISRAASRVTVSSQSPLFLGVFFELFALLIALGRRHPRIREQLAAQESTGP
jgi:hypothetical protein